MNLTYLFISGEDFWRWQTMNPDGYVKDEPFLASVLEQPTAGKTADAAAKVANASNGITSVNGLNGVNDH